MANYLLTGAAGFIAFRVAEFLLEAGHTVYGVDNLNDAYDLRLKHYRLDRLQKASNFHFRKDDISDRAKIDEWMDWLPEDVAGVINLAARAGVRTSLTDPWVYLDTNTLGTLNLLELCRRKGIKKFVLASTSSLYAEVSEPPFSETDDTDHPLQPYAASKKGAESLAHAYHHLYDIDVTVPALFHRVRPCWTPGHGHVPFLPVDCRRQTSGHQWRREAVARLHLPGRYRLWAPSKPSSPSVLRSSTQRP